MYNDSDRGAPYDRQHIIYYHTKTPLKLYICGIILTSWELKYKDILQANMTTLAGSLVVFLTISSFSTNESEVSLRLGAIITGVAIS